MINNFLIRLASFTFQKAMIFGLIAGAIFYFFLYDDGAVMEDEIAKIQVEITAQEKQSQEADAALKEVEQVRVAVGALSDQFKLVSAAIPADVQMADIIRAVDTVARASGVGIKLKEPREPVDKEFYEEIPLSVSIEGDFSQLTMFLYYLTSMERIMKIKNFSISLPMEQRSNASSGSKLVLNGQLVSYRFIGAPANKETKVK
jgi:type IV pilus assembly protein PilO